MSQQKYLFSITHFGEDDADRVAAPFVLANSALALGADVLVWLTVEGAKLGRKGAADGLRPKSFPAVSELLKNFTDNGGQIGVCPPCGRTHGVTDENMVDNGTWIGAAAMLAAAQERQVHTF